MYNDIVNYVIDSLSSKDFSYQELSIVIQRLFEEVSPKLNVGKVNVEIVAKVNPFSDFSEHLFKTLYEGDIQNEANKIVHSYNIKRGGTITTTLFPKDKFTEEEQACISRINFIFTQVLSKYKLEQIVEETPKIDQLSGILNTAGFHGTLGKMIAMHKIGEYNAVFFNIREMKEINRICGGIQNGNIILKKYINCIHSVLGNDEYFARHGGDNFSILFKKESTPKILELLNSVSINETINGKLIQVDVKAITGLYECSNEETTVNIMNGSAAAMNIARKVRDVSVIKFNEEIREKDEMRRRIKDIFPYAIEDGRIRSFFQPKVDSNTYTLYGSEALCRWFTQEGKPVSPGIFIPALEEENLIKQLDFRILEDVCHCINRQLEKGLEPVPISVNFSRNHFSNPKVSEEFVTRLINTIRSYHVDPKYIEVEFTESGIIEDYEVLQGYLDRLHAFGLKVAIDDYGTGYSSLKLLEQVDFDIVKMDKSFADVIGTKEGDIIFSYTTQMIKELGREIVCEGVETEQQVEFLKAIKCNIIQGYYFDRPLPLNEYEERLATKVYKR